MPQPSLLKQKPDRSGYLSEDTIAALASGMGGAVAIVRVSGPEAFPSLERFLHGSADLKKAEPQRLIRGKLFSKEAKQLDDILFARFEAPRSYTGEDVVEYHLHGSSFIVNQVLETLQIFGVRQALPGEFSFRGVRNGKFNLSQAQAVADLIGANNEQAVDLALEKMSGTQTRLVREIAAGLRRLAVLGEVGIDFSDQDVVEVSLPTLAKEVQPLVDRLKHLESSYVRGSRVQEGIPVALIGLPNAGKSSFFNALLGEDRAIVSDIAGTTRDLLREKITLQGAAGSVTFRLEDTAGLRQSTDLIEKMGIERTEKAAFDAEILFFVLDPSQDLEESAELWERLGRPGSKTIGVISKSDRVDSQRVEKAANFLKKRCVESFAITSAITGQGLVETIDLAVTFAKRLVDRKPGEVLLTRLDHLQAVKETLEDLARAKASTELDLFAADLRHALSSLAPLIGETVPDDILGHIFSEFCIGK
jgi:tRNA modification GTPase